MLRQRFGLYAALCSILLSGSIQLHAAARPSSPAQLAELTPSTGSTNDWFGVSIAISNNTVVVGDFDPNIETYGAVYVYEEPSGGWGNMTQVAKLTSSDNGEGFGISVAISGNTIVVGAANTSNFNGTGTSPGAAYVFVEPAGGWTDMTETAKLTASDGQPGDAFGDSVSISTSTIAVGAFFATDSLGNSFAGKAYLFVRPLTGWSGDLNETAELTASDSQLLNYMGASIATNGNTVVAGAYGHNNFQGTAYVFSEPVSGWTSMTQTAELTAAGGLSSADFGFSSAINGETIVEGAPNAFAGRGAAYVFVKPPNGWTTTTQTASLRAPNTVQFNGFGQSVGVGLNSIVAGAPGVTVGSNALQGAVYYFPEPTGGWRNTSKAYELTASDGAAFDNLGVSAAISVATVVAGAPKSSAPGEAYVFGP